MTPRVERALGLDRPLPLVRAVIGAEIDRLIAIMDGLDADPDFEPALGSPENLNGSADQSQRSDIWHAEDDREDEDEHGGDILAEPHDEEPDREEDWRDFPCSEVAA